MAFITVLVLLGLTCSSGVRIPFFIRVDSILIFWLLELVSIIKVINVVLELLLHVSLIDAIGGLEAGLNLVVIDEVTLLGIFLRSFLLGEDISAMEHSVGELFLEIIRAQQCWDTLLDQWMLQNLVDIWSFCWIFVKHESADLIQLIRELRW